MQSLIKPTGALLACTRRKFLSTALQFAGMALSSAACGQFSAEPGPSTSLTVREITMATPDIVCVEVLDAALISFPLRQTAPPTGDRITNVVKNPSAGFRITCTNAPTYAKMLAIRGVTNAGGKFRIQVYSTAVLSNGATVYVNDVGGCPTAEGRWTVSIIDSTHFDLNEPKFSGSYTQGGYVGGPWSGGTSSVSSPRLHVRGVVGTTELNDTTWWGALWSATEIDIVNLFPNHIKFGFHKAFEMHGIPQMENAYVSGGIISRIFVEETGHTNPYTGRTQRALRIGRNNDFLKFNGLTGTRAYNRLDRRAADDVTNYGTIGDRKVTAVHRKSMPYDCTTAYGSGEKQQRMRHYLFLKLDGPLPQGQHNINLTHLGLGIQPFAFNDKTTRAIAIHSTQVGHRPIDPYKRAKLSLWIPGFATEGAVDYFAYGMVGAGKAHLIDEHGAIIHTMAVALRRGPQDLENGHGGWGNISFGIGAIQNVVNNGSGRIRLILADSPKNSRLGTGTRILVYGVNGVAGANGEWTVVRTSNTEFDLEGSTFAGTYKSGGSIKSQHCYSSTTQPKIDITHIDKAVVPCRVIAPGHGLSDRQFIRVGGIRTGRGPTPLNNSGYPEISGTVLVYLAKVIDADTIDLLDQDGKSVDVRFAPAYRDGGGYISRINNSNAAGTYVYDIDFQDFAGRGVFRVYIPGLGVSDPMRFDDATWATCAGIHFAGEYHQRLQCPVDGRFDTTYPYPTYGDGIDTIRQYRSTLPIAFSSQGPVILVNGQHTIPVGQAGFAPWITTKRIRVRGGHMDAADLDSYAWQHVRDYYYLAELYHSVAACRNLHWNMPKLSQVIGSIWDSSTDSLGDVLTTAIFGVDVYRQAMDSDGVTISGQAASSTPAVDDLTQNLHEPSYIHSGKIFTFAGDHLSNYIIAGTLAKIAMCLQVAGFRKQADEYAAAAKKMYAWADSILFSAPNSGGPRDRYYKGALGFGKNVYWDDSRYLELSSIIDSYIAGNLVVARPVLPNGGIRAFAAACLFRLTADIKYQNDAVASYPRSAGFDGFVTPTWWELAHSPKLSGSGSTLVSQNAFQWGNLINAHKAMYHGTDYNGTPNARNAYDNLAADIIGPANYGRGCSVISDSCFGLIHYHLRSKELTGKFDPKPLEIMLAGLQHNNGVNQAGVSLTTELGVRWVRAQLHNNRQMYDDGVVPRGTPTYYYCNFAGMGTPMVQNWNSGPLNQTCDFPDTARYPDDLGKTPTPHRLAFPLYEPPYEASQNIGFMEWTIAGVILGNLQATIYASTWDGNTVTSF